MARKYTLTAICAMCQVAVVGTLETDDERADGLTHYLDVNEMGEPVHVCPPCGEKLNAQKLAEEAAELAKRDEEQLAATARALGVTVETLKARVLGS